MDKDSTKTVKLSDYVKSPRARVVSITTGDNRQRVAQGPAEGRGRRPLGPYADLVRRLHRAGCGDARGERPGDGRPEGLQDRLRVDPRADRARRSRCCGAPTTRCRSTPAVAPRTVDIPTLCHAWLPVGMTLDDVVFESGWKPEPEGVELTQERRGRPDGRAQGRKPRAQQHQRPAGRQGAGRPRVDHRGVGVRRRRWRGRRQRQPAAQPGAATAAAVLGLRARGRLVADDQPAVLPRLARWRSRSARSPQPPSRRRRASRCRGPGVT